MTGLCILDPGAFRRPRNQQATAHLYLANCGRPRGDTPESVLETLARIESDLEVAGLHIGDEGVSYVSFRDPTTAERAKNAISKAADVRWLVKFAELEIAPRGPRVPTSVSSTAHVEVP